MLLSPHLSLLSPTNNFHSQKIVFCFVSLFFQRFKYVIQGTRKKLKDTFKKNQGRPRTSSPSPLTHVRLLQNNFREYTIFPNYLPKTKSLLELEEMASTLLFYVTV